MNTFGTATLRLPLYDAREVRDSRARFRRLMLPLLDRVTSFYCPTGRWPCRGFILMSRYDFAKLSSYGTAFQLELGNANLAHNVGKLKNLSIVQAQCATRGLATDPSALYLVELTDARGVLCNKWFQYPLNAKYNIRAPAYPDVFHPSSLNGGTTWTWATMLQDIWETMTQLGAWPGLPYAPAGVPEGFWFTGVGAWDALCDVLDHLGMTVACDLTGASPYTIVSCGAADASFTALQARYGSTASPYYALEDDLEWLDYGAGRVPGTIKVLFRRRNEVYGTEETVYYGNDGIAQQWDMNMVYSVSVSAPATFTGATGTHYIWSDFTVRYDQDSSPLAADVATAAVIAAERVAQYFDRIYSRTSGSMTQTYAGALPFATGSQVDGVRWWYDGRDHAGWRTELVRGKSPPWPEIY